jgi:hypothetical protein
MTQEHQAGVPVGVMDPAVAVGPAVMAVAVMLLVPRAAAVTATVTAAAQVTVGELKMQADSSHSARLPAKQDQQQSCTTSSSMKVSQAKGRRCIRRDRAGHYQQRPTLSQDLSQVQQVQKKHTGGELQV